MPGEAPSVKPNLSEEQLLPINGLVGRAGCDLLVQHPGTLRHLAYTMGVLASGEPELPVEEWQPRAEVKRAQITDPEQDYIALQEYARMTVGNAYGDHEKYVAARTDSFGIPNRLAVFEEIEYALKWAAEKPQKARTLPDGRKMPAEKQRGLGMGILDIDYFKDINDVLGHPFGDTILKRLSDKLTGTMRHGDTGREGKGVPDYPDWGFVGRLGGDEFAFLLRMHRQTARSRSGRRGVEAKSIEEVFAGASARIELEINEELVIINQEIREERDRQNRLRPANDQLPEIPEIKASFGWQLAGRNETEAKLTRRTDREMYRQKSEGKARDAALDRTALTDTELKQVRRVFELLEKKKLKRYRRDAIALRELYGLAA